MIAFGLIVEYSPRSEEPVMAIKKATPKKAAIDLKVKAADKTKPTREEIAGAVHGLSATEMKKFEEADEVTIVAVKRSM